MQTIKKRFERVRFWKRYCYSVNYKNRICENSDDVCLHFMRSVYRNS